MRFHVVTKWLGGLLIGSGLFLLGIIAAAAVAATGSNLWADGAVLTLAGILTLFVAVPQLASGVLSLCYSGVINQYVCAQSDGQRAVRAHRGLRLAFGFSGIWVMGIVGFAGQVLPKSIATIALAGAMIVVFAAVGPLRLAQWSRPAR